MSLIIHYPLNQSDPTVALVGQTPTQRTGGTVTSVTDPTYGTVAFFDDNDTGLDTPSPTEILSNLPRTFSIWLKRDDLTTAYVLGYGSSSDLQRLELNFNSNNDSFFYTRYGNNNLSLNTNITGAFSVGTWIHLVVTYDGTTMSNYIDGVLTNSAETIGTLNTTNSTLTIGYAGRLGQFDDLGVSGSMTDFRVYDGALDTATVQQLFSNGPNEANIPSLDLTPFTYLIDLEWGEVAGASTYNVKYAVDSGTEQDLVATTDLSYVFYDVIPGASYEFKIYTDLDPIVPFYTETTVTPSTDNANISSLLTRLGNDLTLLADDTVEQFEASLGSVLTTGETVKTSIGSTTFVANAETITLPPTPKERIFTPFDQSSGSGQAVSVILPDTSTVSVSYDETSNEINVGGINYGIDEIFVSGGLKVTVVEI